ncbi:MAG: Ig-like domain-containing protein [Ramlibacter sp.]
MRNYVTSAALLLPAAGALLALPPSVMAQPATPEVSSLSVEADAGLQAGSRLSFTLEGTPRAKATVRVQGIRNPIALREAQPGVYVARYTLKNVDRVGPASELRAALRHGNRIGSETFSLSETMSSAPVAAAPPPPPVASPPALRIDRFGMVPIERLEPGAELQFAVDAVPGAQVSVDLPGVERGVRLRESRPGHYEGTYTIRRADDINPNRPLVATLRLGDRVVTSNMNLAVGRAGADYRPPNVDNQPPNLAFLVPSEGAVVAGGNSVHVAATFQDPGGSGVDPASVQVVVSGRNVTRESQITSQSFSFWGALPPGRQTVDVTARDRAGNVVRRTWSFDVAAATPANVPIQVLNHRNHGEVGSGTTLIEGRTAPNATVAATVQSVAPIGGVINITQNLLSQTVQADANGNFSFSFTPQLAIPGTRYDITMVSTRAGVSLESQLSLVQR